LAERRREHCRGIYWLVYKSEQAKGICGFGEEVLIRAGGRADATFVLGVTTRATIGKAQRCFEASCTTNCLAPWRK